MEKVIIEKDGQKYSVEKFETDGKKTVVEHGVPVEHPYKAGQFVIATVGESAGNRARVAVLDAIEDFGEFKVIQGSADGFFQKDTGGSGEAPVAE